MGKRSAVAQTPASVRAMSSATSSTVYTNIEASAGTPFSTANANTAATCPRLSGKPSPSVMRTPLAAAILVAANSTLTAARTISSALSGTARSPFG